jgi:small subunit ribosomal protein S21
MKIFVRNNDVGKALRILKKKLHNEGVMKEVRDRRHFISKGEQDRLAKKAGVKRWHKKREELEKQFIREERNMLRNSRKNKRNVQRSNKSSNQQRTQRYSSDKNKRSSRS